MAHLFVGDQVHRQQPLAELRRMRGMPRAVAPVPAAARAPPHRTSTQDAAAAHVTTAASTAALVSTGRVQIMVSHAHGDVDVQVLIHV